MPESRRVLREHECSVYVEECWWSQDLRLHLHRSPYLLLQLSSQSLQLSVHPVSLQVHGALLLLALLSQ